jgi:hypothetical protein
MILHVLHNREYVFYKLLIITHPLTNENSTVVRGTLKLKATELDQNFLKYKTNLHYTLLVCVFFKDFTN